MSRSVLLVALTATLTLSSAADAFACSGRLVTPAENLVSVAAASAANETLCLADGTYRVGGSVVLKEGMTLMAVNPRGALIDGSRVRTSATRLTNGTWRMPTSLSPTRNNGTPGKTMLEPEELYRESVFYDGLWLEKVGVKLESGTVVGAGVSTVGPGEVFVDYRGDALVIGDVPTGHTVEVTTVNELVTSTAPGVTISGVRVRGANNIGIRAAGDGSRVEDVESWNNADRGVQINGIGSQLVRSYIHDNGVYGVTSLGSTDVTVDGIEVSANDRKGMRTKALACSASGGSKFTRTTRLTVSGSSFHDNECNAIWFDINSVDAVISGNSASRNRYGSGILYEISFGATISGNTTLDNDAGGIVVFSSPGVEVSANTAAGNGGIRTTGDIMLIGAKRLDSPSDLGAHLVRDAWVHHNTVTVTSGVGITNKGDPDPAQLLDPTVNRFASNTYRVASCETATAWRWGPASDALSWARWTAIPNDIDPEAACLSNAAAAQPSREEQ